MKQPHRASRDPLKGAARANQQSRPGSALDGAASRVRVALRCHGKLA